MSLSENSLQKEFQRDKQGFFKQVVDKTSEIGNEISKAIKSTKEINRRSSVLSTTAKIEANRSGDVGRNFLVVSESIDQLSRKTDTMLDKMKNETVQEIGNIAKIIKNKSISIQGNRLTNLALINIRLVDRSLFERSADIRWWATDDVLVDYLIGQNNVGFQQASNRLGVILKSYTVYYDLILCDLDGLCVASSEEKFHLTGKNFSDKPWFKSAMNTKDGEEYGFDTVHHSPSINDDLTVIFSCKVHEDGNTEKRVIGIIGAVFKWKEFVQRIVADTPLLSDELAKTRILICDDDGNVIADTKDRILQQIIQFNGRKELFQKQKGFKIVEKNGVKKLVCHALSPGFEGYKSENWHSLIIQDIDDDYLNCDLSDNNDESLDSVIGLISNLSDETTKAIKEIDKINDETHVLSLNAAIESARVGDAGRGFGVISKFMGDLSKTTSEITSIMDSNTPMKLRELHSFISSNSRKIKGDRLANLSFTNIDLIDRALYERTADVRWWSAENSIVEALTRKTNDHKNLLTSRIATILKYYTVYEDLIVCDTNGDVIANGKLNKTTQENMSNTQWFQNTLKNSVIDYRFDVVHKQKDSDSFTELVFSCKVHKNGNILEDVIGVIGVIFKWEHFAKTIFYETPLNENEINSTSMFVLDANGHKLTEHNKFGNKILEKDFLPLLVKKKNFETVTLNGMETISAHAQSVGYEGFSTGWHTVIVQSL